MSQPKILVTLTVSPPGKRPVFSVRSIPYTDISTVLGTVVELLSTEPLSPYLPETEPPIDA